MKNLIAFESFSPDLEEVNKVKSYLKSKFKILEGDVLGDKVNDDLKYRESSIRKVKDFINGKII